MKHRLVWLFTFGLLELDESEKEWQLFYNQVYFRVKSIRNNKFSGEEKDKKLLIVCIFYGKNLLMV